MRISMLDDNSEKKINVRYHNNRLKIYNLCIKFVEEMNCFDLSRIELL